jgi:hypothetical protein
MHMPCARALPARVRQSGAAHAARQRLSPRRVASDTPRVACDPRSQGDFMNLAYTLSTMYKRVHPERKANSSAARRVKYYVSRPTDDTAAPARAR